MKAFAPRTTTSLGCSLGLALALGTSSGTSGGSAAAAADGEVKTSANGQRVNSLGMALTRVPAGTFVMGLPDKVRPKEPLAGYEAHTVRIGRAFYIGTYEVTAAEYRAVMPAPADSAQADAPGPANAGDRMPATSVSWHDATKFCRKLSALPAEHRAGRRYRLPTEAEWEYACRGGSSAPFQRGDISEAESKMRQQLQAVGTFSPNGFGLYDMRDNAWEWCADWHSEDYYQRSAPADPQGPATGILRVVRGRDWLFGDQELCLLVRDPMAPSRSSPLVGFRVVCEVRSSGHRGLPKAVARSGR